MQSTNLYDIYLTLYVQSLTPDEGRKDRPKHLDDRLTVHRSITLVDLQIDAQNSYLITYNIFIKILYMFRALLCSSSGGLPEAAYIQLRRRPPEDERSNARNM